MFERKLLNISITGIGKWFAQYVLQGGLKTNLPGFLKHHLVLGTIGSQQQDLARHCSFVIPA